MVQKRSDWVSEVTGHAGTDRRADDPDRVQMGWTVAAVCAIVVAAVVLNFFPERIGVVKSLLDPGSFVPLLRPEFEAHLPWLNLWCGLALTVNLVNLFHGRWQPATRWADLALSVLGICILFRLAGGDPVVRLGSAWAAWLDWSGAWVERTLSVLYKVALVSALVLQIMASSKKLLRLIGGRLTWPLYRAS